MNRLIEKYCDPEWLDFLSENSFLEHFQAGEVIFNIGEKTKGLHIINSGKVKIIARTDKKTNRLIRLASKDDIIGHRGFGGEWKYTIAAIALTEVEVLFIPLEVFTKVVKSNAEFGYFMMMFFAQELRESENLASMLPIKSIIASVILNNYESFGFEKGSKTKLSYTLSRSDIASMAGTRYETVIRTIAELIELGILKSEGKQFHILDLSQLKKYSKGK
jgi:CRP-like cAMP-binding protein